MSTFNARTFQVLNISSLRSVKLNASRSKTFSKMFKLKYGADYSPEHYLPFSEFITKYESSFIIATNGSIFRYYVDYDYMSKQGLIDLLKSKNLENNIPVDVSPPSLVLTTSGNSKYGKLINKIHLKHIEYLQKKALYLGNYILFNCNCFESSVKFDIIFKTPTNGTKYSLYRTNSDIRRFIKHSSENVPLVKNIEYSLVTDNDSKDLYSNLILGVYKPKEVSTDVSFDTKWYLKDYHLNLKDELLVTNEFLSTLSNEEKNALYDDCLNLLAIDNAPKDVDSLTSLIIAVISSVILVVAYVIQFTTGLPAGSFLTNYAVSLIESLFTGSSLSSTILGKLLPELASVIHSGIVSVASYLTLAMYNLGVVSAQMLNLIYTVSVVILDTIASSVSQFVFNSSFSLLVKALGDLLGIDSAFISTIAQAGLAVALNPSMVSSVKSSYIAIRDDFTNAVVDFNPIGDIDNVIDSYFKPSEDIDFLGVRPETIATVFTNPSSYAQNMFGKQSFRKDMLFLNSHIIYSDVDNLIPDNYSDTFIA